MFVHLQELHHTALGSALKALEAVPFRIYAEVAVALIVVEGTDTLVPCALLTQLHVIKVADDIHDVRSVEHSLDGSVVDVFSHIVVFKAVAPPFKKALLNNQERPCMCAWRVCVVACPLPRLPIGGMGPETRTAGAWVTVVLYL